MALDRDKKPALVASSNMGQVLASEILPAHIAKQVAERLFASDLYTGWGIRTLGSREHRYNPMSYHNGSIWPHDNSIIAYGLAKYREKEKLVTLVEAFFNASLFLPEHRMPELYCGFPRRRGVGPTHYPVACSPQAWAVGTVFLMVASLLGLEVRAMEKQIVFHSPTLPPFLDFLQLSDIALTESEKFSVRCNRYGSDIGLDVIVLPPGWEVIIKK